MNINEIYSGFKLLSIKKIKDLDSNLYEFKHEKSGATLVYLENDDTNKCFSIGFRTLPEDSTGVCHIIEHSLLCGSKKYPVKEPFVNLLKGSMATFLNAMTSSDFTMYPVASQNDKDFDNLMSVYLDAVFAPICMLDEKPFLQEGWHYELNSKDELPSYKGIVYNEMKGHMSGVERQLEEHLETVFYKGSCYEYNSGGDPDVIPSLTFNYYKEFYHKHYHPSNGIIYLYGDMDIKEKLEFIDKEYLSLFVDEGVKIEIKMPEARIVKDEKFLYAIGQDEELENNTYMSIAFALDHAENVRDLVGFSILSQALMSTNASPLKKALLDKELGFDVTAGINESTILPSYLISLHKTNEDKKDEFYNTIISECKRLVSEGIDKEILLAIINRSEFENKEMDTGTMPKGLLFAFSIMQSFNYDFRYETLLEMSPYFQFYKDELHNGYFEGLLEKYILNTKHCAMVTLIPSKELEEQKEKEMNEKMAQLKANMSEEEIEECIRVTQELIAYQNRKDEIEDVEKLPKLKLEDISTKVIELPTKVETKNDIEFISHNFNTNKIGYLRLYFDLNVVSIDELPYITILNNLLGKLDTKNYSVSKLQTYIKTYLGSLVFSSTATSQNKESYVLKQVVTASALLENISHISTIINEVVNNTILDEEKVRTILLQMKNRFKNGIIENGMGAASTLIRSTLSKEGVISSKMSGLEMYNFLCDLTDNLDFELLKEKLTSLMKKVYSKENIIASVSGDIEVLNALENEVFKLNLSDITPTHNLHVLIENNIGDALVVSSGVSNNVMAINLKDLGEVYSGKLHVLQHILNYDYLWPEVRVKGGAYGANFQINSSEDVVFGSYCDPNVKNTYDVYEGTAFYLENLETDESEFKSYLIGAMAKFDAPVSNFVRILVADGNLFRNNTAERRERIKKEAIETTLEDIKGYSKLFKKIAQLSNVYTIGNETAINQYSRLEKINKLK